MNFKDHLAHWADSLQTTLSGSAKVSPVKTTTVKPYVGGASVKVTDNPRAGHAESEKEGDKFSLAQHLTSFALETSMHGARKVTHQGGSKRRRLLWCMLVLGMSCYLLYTLSTLYASYASFPHTTSFKVERKQPMNLPAISVCLPSPFDKHRLASLPHGDVIQHLLQTTSELKHFFPRRVSDDEFYDKLHDVYLDQLVASASFSAEQVFALLMIDDQPTNVTEAFKTINFLSKRCFIYNSALQDGQGDPKPYVQQQMPQVSRISMFLTVPESDLLLETVSGVQVFMHDPWEFPNFFGSSAGIASGSYTTILLSPVQYRFLPKPFKSFGESDCLDVEADDFRSPLSYMRNYSWFNCLAESVVNFSSTSCNCSAHWIRDNLETERCNLPKERLCYLSKAVARLHTESSPTEGRCAWPCAFKEYYIKWNSISFPSEQIAELLSNNSVIGRSVDQIRKSIFLDIKFESAMEMILEHRQALTMDDIYSLLGGQMGLFLGASILTVMEILEVFLSTGWGLFRSLWCRG